jgi:histidine kinase-, DNA gyrase B-, and HSP90-like ATPase
VKNIGDVNIGKEIMEEILPKVLENRIPSSEFENITPSLIEMLSNCAEHAYLEGDEYNKYYLIAGEYENTNHKRSGTFAFSIVDLGQGFRSSLEKEHGFSKDDEDSNLLSAAINGEMTSETGGGKDSGRGAGLISVLDYIKKIGGSIHAYSDKGFYKLFRLDDGRVDTVTGDRKTKMRGSIMEIGLPYLK